MPHTSTRNDERTAEPDPAVLGRLFEQVYSKGELLQVPELVAQDFVGHSTESADAYRGPDGVKAHASRLRRAFHGFTVDIDEIDVEGSTFEASWTARGTHERRFLGVEPTCVIGEAGEEPQGVRISVDGVARGTIRGDSIQEIEMVWDVAALEDQLGASVELPGSTADPFESAPRGQSRLAPEVR